MTLLVAAILALPLLLASWAAAYVYWAQPNSDGSAREIARANLDGSQAGQTLVANPSLVRGIAVDSSARLLGQRLGDRARRLDGLNDDPLFIADLSDATTLVAVDADHVYWTDYVPSSAPVEQWGTIGRANLDGTGVDRTFITGLPPWAVNGIAVDDAHIYWGDWLTTASAAPISTEATYRPTSSMPATRAAWPSMPITSTGRTERNRTRSVVPTSTAARRSDLHSAPHLSALDRRRRRPPYWTLYECVGNCEFFRGRIVRANLDGADVDNGFISTGTKTPFGLAVDALGPPGRATAKQRQRQQGHRIRITVEACGGHGPRIPGNGCDPGQTHVPAQPRVGEIDAGASETLRLRPKHLAARGSP